MCVLFKFMTKTSNGRESISLIEQRSECDVEMLEWMMSDSDITWAICTIYLPTPPRMVRDFWRSFVFLVEIVKPEAAEDSGTSLGIY